MNLIQFTKKIKKYMKKVNFIKNIIYFVLNKKLFVEILICLKILN